MWFKKRERDKDEWFEKQQQADEEKLEKFKTEFEQQQEEWSTQYPKKIVKDNGDVQYREYVPIFIERTVCDWGVFFIQFDCGGSVSCCRGELHNAMPTEPTTRLHREDGPAVSKTNGYKEWWVHGKLVKTEFGTNTPDVVVC